VARIRRPTRADVEQAVESLRTIAELTTGLPDDSPSDAQLRDRLDLAADVLEATVRSDGG
jgi:hypothetical protein